MAMAGEPYHVKMPEIWGVRLEGELPEWVSAKDVILEMLRRHDVDGGYGRIIEYHGPGLAGSERDGPPRDRQHGRRAGRHHQRVPLRRRDAAVPRLRGPRGRLGGAASPTTTSATTSTDEIDLSQLVPLIALPSSPGKVKPVTEVAGTEITQVLIGSSANPGLRDFEIAAAIVAGRQANAGVSFDINPTSRQSLEELAHSGAVATLVAAGARLNQTGCLGCIGVGQAPASGTASLRTVPAQLPGPVGHQGRSGVPVLAGDRRRVRAERPDHRPSRASSIDYPIARAAAPRPREHEDARRARPGSRP